MQSLCTLRHHCRQWPCNTRCQADATPYLGRTFTGWIAPACGWRTHSITSTVEHPFGTLKMRMGATHFLMKRLPKVATEMALHVLAYNLTRVMNIIGVQRLLAAMRACLGCRQGPVFA